MFAVVLLAGALGLFGSQANAQSVGYGGWNGYATAGSGYAPATAWYGYAPSTSGYVPVTVAQPALAPAGTGWTGYAPLASWTGYNPGAAWVGYTPTQVAIPVNAAAASPIVQLNHVPGPNPYMDGRPHPYYEYGSGRKIALAKPWLPGAP